MDRKVEDFVPIEEGKVGMYCCGPTVYNYAHIGNLRTFIFEDVLHKTLQEAGYSVKHVMNITDVGHLTGDGDDGEDKLGKRSRETGKSVWDIAKFYTDAFFADEKALNIERPQVVCKATDHIQDMIALIQRLEEKGHTYTAGGNVYFSIDTIDDYGKLAGQKQEDKLSGARIVVDGNKRNPQDFVLWFTNSKFGEQAMMWDSPWGRGYPGWHIECSAMSMKYLGEHFDIHCGGIDAIPVHHTNEIAQSECATGKPFSRFWMHGEFLRLDGAKMSKSSGEFLTVSVLVDKGYNPLDYRLFALTSHYRNYLNFSFESLDSAREALKSLHKKTDPLMGKATAIESEEAKKWRQKFKEAIGDDLNMPRALGILNSVLKTDLSEGEKAALVADFDRVLGLKLDEPRKDYQKKTDSASSDDSEQINSLVAQRTEARKAKNWAESDRIRDLLKGMGVEIKDGPQGTTWTKK